MAAWTTKWYDITMSARANLRHRCRTRTRVEDCALIDGAMEANRWPGGGGGGGDGGGRVTLAVSAVHEQIKCYKSSFIETLQLMHVRACDLGWRPTLEGIRNDTSGGPGWTQGRV